MHLDHLSGYMWQEANPLLNTPPSNQFCNVRYWQRLCKN